MRVAVVAALVLCFVASAARAEEVLYCADTDVAGFVWKSGQAHRAFLNPERYTVKVMSANERIITRTVGDAAGASSQFRCERALFDPPDYRIVCIETLLGFYTWVFKGNAFTRSIVVGGPVGGDPNIVIAYGTCTKF